MIQEVLSCEAATQCLAALSELFEAIPRKKQHDYLGHLNTIALFLEVWMRRVS